MTRKIVSIVLALCMLLGVSAALADTLPGKYADAPHGLPAGIPNTRSRKSNLLRS